MTCVCAIVTVPWLQAKDKRDRFLEFCCGTSRFVLLPAQSSDDRLVVLDNCDFGGYAGRDAFPDRRLVGMDLCGPVRT